MFLSLFYILFFGFFGGLIVEKLKIPKIVYYLVLGILFSPSLLNVIDKSLLDISSYLRQIALVIILTRSGLSLDLKSLKKIGRSAILMCFVPACFEIIGIVIFAPIFLHLSIMESLLLGSVLAAVSPAIVVPRMIKLKESGYGNKHHVSELIMAGSSCDDIFVIVLFYSFKSMVLDNKFDYMTLLKIPSSILLGVFCGLLIVFFISFVFKKIKISTSFEIITLLAISFGMIALEDSIKKYVSISSLLAIIVIGILINKKNSDEAKTIQRGYNSLWNFFEILLFVLVGAITDVKLAFSIEGCYILLTLIIALLFRCIGVILCVLHTEYNIKEKIFIMISYIPKATVQASIGAIALNENLSCGKIVLTGAVISILFTAPIGAILMDLLYKKLLVKDDDYENTLKRTLIRNL